MSSNQSPRGTGRISAPIAVAEIEIHFMVFGFGAIDQADSPG